MVSNRILALLLFFILIPIGFLLIFRPSPFFPVPLRKDKIPTNAYIVPWMTPSESIASLYATPPQSEPWNLSFVMQGALRFDVVFHITVPNGTRTIPSMIYLGHDSNLLYAGGIFRGMYTNPNAHWNPDNVTYDVPSNYLNILLDVDDDGVLSSPESGSAPYVFIPCQFNPSRCGLGQNGWGSADLVPGYSDLAWRDTSDYHHGIFDIATNICTSPSTLAGIAAEYNFLSGDLVMIFARRLSQANSCANGLQMRIGERWAMGFLFELGYSTEAPLADYVSGWPFTAYPYLSSDSSSWPKLVIDLTNPPKMPSTL